MKTQTTAILKEQEIKDLIKAKLENKISSLPYRFWKSENGKHHSKIAIKFLIEDYLQLNKSEIPTKITAKTFHDAGLYRLLVEYFESSYYKALEYVYPGEFKPWQFPKGMTGIWNGKEGKERAREAILYLLNNLEIALDEIPKKVDYNTFKMFRLGGMLQTLFNSSPYLAIESVYPNKFKPWEFRVKNYWIDKTFEDAQKATKWLVEEKLGLNEKELNQVKRRHFTKYSLQQMLKIFYENTHIRALVDAYPNFLKSRSI